MTEISMPPNPSPWNRTSELADLPLWLIHVAWPVAGVTWIVFAGEQILDELQIMLGAKQ